jgi:hypothetical protein
MAQPWLEIVSGASRGRRELKRGLTIAGPAGGDLPVAGAGSDQLHLWDEPPKLVFVGAGEPPKVNGAAREEALLASGDLVEWHELGFRFATDAPRAALAEVAVRSEPAPVSAPASGWSSADERAWRRLRAGMLVELGLVEPSVARRWQDAVLRGEFEPDACAREIDGASRAAVGDARVDERSVRLMRDLVMAPALSGIRGASRRARTATRGGLAFALVQFLVLGICALLVFVALAVVRWRWGFSVDGFLDRVAEALAGS